MTKEIEFRLLQLEGQVNALTRAWLYLAASMEEQGGLDPEQLEKAMLRTHWDGVPLEPYAVNVMQALVDQLSDARETRTHYQPKALDE